MASLNPNTPKHPKQSSRPPLITGEIIEARQALFFIAVVLLLGSAYPLLTSGLSLGVTLSLGFAVTALALGFWSRTNPVQAFKVGFIISLVFVLSNFLIFNIFGSVIAGVFSLAFYRGWKYAKIHHQQLEDYSREDILDEGF